MDVFLIGFCTTINIFIVAQRQCLFAHYAGPHWRQLKDWETGTVLFMFFSLTAPWWSIGNTGLSSAGGKKGSLTWCVGWWSVFFFKPLPVVPGFVQLSGSHSLGDPKGYKNACGSFVLHFCGFVSPCCDWKLHHTSGRQEGHSDTAFWGAWKHVAHLRFERTDFLFFTFLWVGGVFGYLVFFF